MSRTPPSKRTKPWHVVNYGSCPRCDAGSLGIRLDGKFVRHTLGHGSVDCKASICPASNRTMSTALADMRSQS